MATAHLAPAPWTVGEFQRHQYVWTYCPDRWPAGLISGQADIQGGFQVRHIVTFRRGLLLAMLRAGVAEATARGFPYLHVVIPVDFPPARQLVRVAERLGFEPVGMDAVAYSYVRYL